MKTEFAACMTEAVNGLKHKNGGQRYADSTNSRFGGLLVFTAIVSVRLGAFQPESKRVVPMNSVCATFAQDEVKSVDAIADAAFAETMGALRERSAQIVLCNGNDIAAAVKSSGESFRM